MVWFQTLILRLYNELCIAGYLVVNTDPEPQSSSKATWKTLSSQTVAQTEGQNLEETRLSFENENF